MGKLPDEQTGQMILFACKQPKENAETIVGTGLPRLGHTGNNICCEGTIWRECCQRHGIRSCQNTRSTKNQVQSRYESFERLMELDA